MMKIKKEEKHITEQIITSRLSQDKKETHIFIEGNTAVMDSTIPRDFRKALKQNWEPISVTKYEDGTVCGMMLRAPRKRVRQSALEMPLRYKEKFRQSTKRSWRLRLKIIANP